MTFTTPSVSCPEHTVENTKATFILQANLIDVEIEGFQVSKQGSSTGLCTTLVYTPNGGAAATPPSLLQKGQKLKVECTGAANAFGTKGESVALDLELTWKKKNGVLELTEKSSAIAVIG